MTSKFTTACLALLCLSVLFLAGCINTAEMFRGDEVSNEHVVAITESGPYTGSMQTFDIVINYDFVRSSETLDIAGQVALTERFPLLYGRVSNLDTFLFFVDDANRVLKTVSLASAETGDPAESLVFDKSLAIPASAVGISFGYRGVVKDGGDDKMSSMDYSFDLLPRQI